MTEQEILEKAVRKAIDGGFDPEPYFKTLHINVSAIVDNPLQAGLLFNHDFAKALWGEEPTDAAHGFSVPKGARPVYQLWQYHLQQMVIAEDPIKYLGEHLDG